MAVIASQAHHMMMRWPRLDVDVDSDGEWFMLTRFRDSQGCGCVSAIDKRLQGQVIVDLCRMEDPVQIQVTFSECHNIWEGVYSLSDFLDKAASYEWLHEDCRLMAVFDGWAQEFRQHLADPIPSVLSEDTD